MDTPVCMDYGSADVTQIFFWLLQNSAFSYKLYDPINKLGESLLNQIKIGFYCVNLNVCDSQEIVKTTEIYTLQDISYIVRYPLCRQFEG